jgi:hypothetical protein
VCSESREVARLRRDRFLIANIPTTVHLRITLVKLAKNLRESEVLEIHLLFGVVRQAAVTVGQIRELTREADAMSILQLPSRIS